MIEGREALREAIGANVPVEYVERVYAAVSPLLAAERERREAAEAALRGLVDLVEAWMNGLIKRVGIEWESPADHPPALRLARATLAASDGEDAP